MKKLSLLIVLILFATLANLCLTESHESPLVIGGAIALGFASSAFTKTSK